MQRKRISGELLKPKIVSKRPYRRDGRASRGRVVRCLLPASVIENIAGDRRP